MKSIILDWQLRDAMNQCIFDLSTGYLCESIKDGVTELGVTLRMPDKSALFITMDGIEYVTRVHADIGALFHWMKFDMRPVNFQLEMEVIPAP